MHMCVFVPVCEEMSFGIFCEGTSTTLDSLPFPLANSSRWLSSIRRACLGVLWHFHLAFPVCVPFSPLPVPLSRMEHFRGSVPAGTMFIWAPRFLDQAATRSKRTQCFPLSHYQSVNITTQKLLDPLFTAGCSLGPVTFSPWGSNGFTPAQTAAAPLSSGSLYSLPRAEDGGHQHLAQAV